jgi:chromosome segregation ATPase
MFILIFIVHLQADFFDFFKGEQTNYKKDVAAKLDKQLAKIKKRQVDLNIELKETKEMTSLIKDTLTTIKNDAEFSMKHIEFCQKRADILEDTAKKTFEETKDKEKFLLAKKRLNSEYNSCLKDNETIQDLILIAKSKIKEMEDKYNRESKDVSYIEKEIELIKEEIKLFENRKIKLGDKK